eukprot:PhF_6_TR26311/c3_g1_i3/m.37787
MTSPFDIQESRATFQHKLEQLQSVLRSKMVAQRGDVVGGGGGGSGGNAIGGAQQQQHPSAPTSSQFENNTYLDVRCAPLDLHRFDEELLHLQGKYSGVRENQREVNTQPPTAYGNHNTYANHRSEPQDYGNADNAIGNFPLESTVMSSSQASASGSASQRLNPQELISVIKRVHQTHPLPSKQPNVNNISSSVANKHHPSRAQGMVGGTVLTAPHPRDPSPPNNAPSSVTAVVHEQLRNLNIHTGQQQQHPHQPRMGRNNTVRPVPTMTPPPPSSFPMATTNNHHIQVSPSHHRVHSNPRDATQPRPTSSNAKGKKLVGLAETERANWQTSLRGGGAGSGTSSRNSSGPNTPRGMSAHNPNRRGTTPSRVHSVNNYNGNSIWSSSGPGRASSVGSQLTATPPNKGMGGTTKQQQQQRVTAASNPNYFQPAKKAVYFPPSARGGGAAANAKPKSQPSQSNSRKAPTVSGGKSKLVAPSHPSIFKSQQHEPQQQQQQQQQQLLRPHSTSRNQRQPSPPT